MLTIKIPRDPDWLPTDLVELWLGTENAASLAASIPAGGTLVRTVSPWPQGTTRGGWGRFLWGRNAWGLSTGGYAWGSAGSVWGRGAWGRGFAPVLTITHQYLPTLRCCTLPVGVRIRDAAGNRTAGPETVVVISEPPRGARNLAATSTGTTPGTGSVKLTWTPSPDV